MNQLLPQWRIGSMHCSANVGEAGEAVSFFELSGTCKTTLSTNSKGRRIGGDEHVTDDSGVHNFEIPAIFDAALADRLDEAKTTVLPCSNLADPETAAADK